MTVGKMPMLHDQDFLEPLFSGECLDKHFLIHVMQLARRIDPKDIDLANSIYPLAGEYLPEHWIRFVIRADVTDEDIKAEISRQQAFFDRLLPLLPSLINYLSIEEREDVLNALSCLSDCHADFGLVEGAQRHDKSKRELLDSLNAAIQSVKATITTIDEVAHFVDVDFDRIHEIYAEKATFSKYSFAAFKHDLALYQNCLQIARYRAKIEDEYIHIPNNQTRTHVVEYAYTMSCFWNGPKLVTTPGSEFSAFCSLLYEAVAGTLDASLAGAINRFARSEERRRFDLGEVEDGPDSDETGDVDNFGWVKSVISRVMIECEKYRAMLSSSELDDGAKLVVKLMMARELDRADAAEKKYGPNLLWAHQLDPATLEDIHRSVETIKAERRRQDIEIGQHRRGVPKR